MKRAKHPNVVEFIGAYKKNNDLLWVIMELMDGACLSDVLEHHLTAPLNEAQMARVACDVCNDDRLLRID